MCKLLLTHFKSQKSPAYGLFLFICVCNFYLYLNYCCILSNLIGRLSGWFCSQLKKFCSFGLLFMQHWFPILLRLSCYSGSELFLHQLLYNIETSVQLKSWTVVFMSKWWYHALLLWGFPGKFSQIFWDAELNVGNDSSSKEFLVYMVVCRSCLIGFNHH